MAVVAFYDDRYGKPSDVQGNTYAHHLLPEMTTPYMHHYYGCLLENEPDCLSDIAFLTRFM